MSARSIIGRLWRHASATARVEQPVAASGRGDASTLDALARAAVHLGATAPREIPAAVVSAAADLGADAAWFVVPRHGGVIVGAATAGHAEDDLEQVVPTAELARWLTAGAHAGGGVDRPGVACVPVAVAGQPVAAVVTTWAARGEQAVAGDAEAALRILTAQAATALANADRVRTAEEVVARLREVERLRHDLISTAAHELRTPTTVIRGVAELLDQRWGAFEETQRREFVSRVTHHVGALEHVLDQLASFIEFSAGTTRLVDPRPVDLADLVGRAIDAHAERLDQHVVVRSLEPVEVLADTAVLERMVGELLRNAATHTPPGTRVEVRLDLHAGRARLVVQDDGPGAPGEPAATLTDPFARSGDVLTRETRGIGLGLTFVDHAVRAHGGQLDLTSDQGFRATIHLPPLSDRLLGTPVEEEARHRPTTPSARPTVLVVEDDSSLRALADLTLSDAGCLVTAVGDGRAAVRAATTRPPDVIVLDVELPGLDGREVARLLRDDEATANVPIVVVTGSADSRELWSIWSSGADALLMKPYDVTELTDTVLGLAGRPHTDLAADRERDDGHDATAGRRGTA